MSAQPLPPTPTLLEALRALLAAEGRPPSRARLAALIEAGAARLDGRVVRDPGQPVEQGARLSFDLDDIGSEGATPSLAAYGARRPTPRMALPAGVLHADPQLVVVERAAFAAEAPLPFAAEVASRLRRERLFVPDDPSAPGAGPVALAGSESVRRALATSFAEGRVLETLLSLRTPAQAGLGEAIVERATARVAGRELPCALLRRDEASCAPAPPGARHLVPPQRLALALKHPRTNRRLVFSVEPQPSFLEACAAAGVASLG